jgi:O-antigen ligase
MIWILGGYMWLYVHRPFEVWPFLGDLQIERLYMIFAMVCWILYSGKGWVMNRLHLAFLVFTVILVLCWLASPYSELGSKVVEDHIKVGVFYFLVLASVRDEKTLRTLLCLYLASMGLYMLHSLWEFHQGRFVFRMATPRLIGVDATYNDPNTFAATVLYALPMSFPFWAERPRGALRALLLGYSGLSLVCILLTGSRGGLVGLLCLGVLWLWRSQRRFQVLFALALLPMVAWPVLPAELQNRFYTLIDPSAGPVNAQGSAMGRLAGLLDGIKLWGRSPVTGFGPGSFGKAVGHGFQAHNLYGQTLGELGSLGAVALAVMVFAFLLNGLESRRLHKRQPAGQADFPYELSRAVSLCVILLLIMGCGGHNLYRYTWLWFGAFQAIAIFCMRSRKSPALGGEHERLRRRSALEAAAFAARSYRGALAGRRHPYIRPV